MSTAVKTLIATVCVVLLAAGATAVGYATWTGTIADADRALAAGQYDQALAAYQAAEARFDRVPAVRQLVADDYQRVVANQLWILYHLNKHDELIEKAERAPEEAAPHFWTGLVFFSKARGETKPEGQLGWLTRSEEELRRAVESAPGDFDTKYDFELVTRLAAALRQQPKNPPKQLMQLLRPQPKLGSKPAPRIG